MELKRIGVLSTGKVFAAMYLVFGVIAGVFMAIAAIANGNADNPGAGGASLAMAIIFPILYSLGGFIGGIIAAALYNFVVPFIGGLELDLAPRSPQ